jgi:two-component system phosphate regulon sensor histidine kinase PhoR
VSNLWDSTLASLTLICLFALVLWPLGGLVVALAVLAGGLLILLLTHLRKLVLLVRWAREPLGTLLPDRSDAWGAVFSALNQRVKKSLELRDELTDRLERFRKAGQAMPDGVVILGPHNTIDWINPAAENLLGLSADKDLGRLITNLVRQPEFASHLNGGDYTGPLILRSLRSITQIERLETMRRDFVANVSHELKTPLTVIVGFVETLIDTLGELPREEAKHYLQTAMEQAKRMQRLVDDLLILAALETESYPAEEEIEVCELLNEIKRDAQVLSAGRHRIEVDCQASARLIASPKELRSALINLAINAVRYTLAGGSIRLRWVPAPDGAQIRVEDTGIGIEAHHIPRLTERFYRVDRGRSRESGGTGLGLAIVKHVLTRHQARLSVESEPGKGSCFIVHFPKRRILSGSKEVRC